MNIATTRMATLSQYHLPTITDSRIRQFLFALTGSLLLTLSAKLSIPLYPVPITMQTLVVLLIGFVFGPRLAGLTVCLYLLEGIIGLPVFQGSGSGIIYMTGPTGGYLAGFLVATVVCGKLAQLGWDRRVVTTFAGMLIGNLIIYGCGLTWLSTYTGFGSKLLQLGLIPFLLGDLLKIAIAVVLLPWAWKCTIDQRN